MPSYSIEVLHAGERLPMEVVELTTAKAVLAAIPKLLKRHPDCHRIRVLAGATHVFSVDCKGLTVQD